MINETRQQLTQKLEARTMERDAAREGCSTFLEQRDNLKKMLDSIEITGPDADGLLWVHLKGAVSAAFSAHMSLITGRALEEFRTRLEFARKYAAPH